MNFGPALGHAKQGEKIARKGWNGKNMWVSMTPGKTLDLSKHNIWPENFKDVAVQNGGKVEILPYMIMKTVDNKIVIGWLASQTDMLADDWFVVNKDNSVNDEKKRSSGFIKLPRDELISLYKKGYSTIALGNLYCVSRVTIRNRLLDYNVPLSSMHDRQKKYLEILKGWEK